MYKVVGFKPVEYDRKKDGKHIKGTTLFVLDKEQHPNITGFQTMELWLSQYCAYVPTVGDNVRVYFNRYGGVEEVISCNE